MYKVFLLCANWTVSLCSLWGLTYCTDIWTRLTNCLMQLMYAGCNIITVTWFFFSYIWFVFHIFFIQSQIQAILCVNTVWQCVHNHTSAKLLWSVLSLPCIFINTSHNLVCCWQLTSNTVCTMFLVYNVIDMSCNSSALFVRHNSFLT